MPIEPQVNWRSVPPLETGLLILVSSWQKAISWSLIVRIKITKSQLMKIGITNQLQYSVFHGKECGSDFKREKK